MYPYPKKNYAKENDRLKTVVALLAAVTMTASIITAVNIGAAKKSDRNATQYQTLMYQQMSRADSLQCEIEEIKSEIFSRIMNGEY